MCGSLLYEYLSHVKDANARGKGMRSPKMQGTMSQQKALTVQLSTACDFRYPVIGLWLPKAESIVSVI